MSLTERAAYLRGLYDGLELDASKSKEARLMNAIIDVLEEMSGHITENEESITSLADQVDDVAENLSELEELLLEDDMEYDEDDELLDDEDDGFETVFQVECPNCQRMLTIDEQVLSEGEVECETCGQRFSVDLEFEEDEEDAALSAGDEEEIPF